MGKSSSPSAKSPTATAAPKKEKKLLTKKLDMKPAKVLEHVGKEEKIMHDVKEKKKDTKGSKSSEGKERKGKEGKELKVIRADVKRKKKNKGDKQSYAYYIHKVFKTVHPQQSGEPRCNLSVKAMSILDSLAHDLYTQLSTEAIKLTKRDNKRTLTSAGVQTATRLVLPGELAKHAMGDGTKAVLNFQQRG